MCQSFLEQYSSRKSGSCHLLLYHNASKIRPPPFSNEVAIVKGAFLSKVCPPIYACGYVRQEPPKKQHCKRRKKADNICCYCIKESLCMYTNRTTSRLTACEVGVLSQEKCQNSWKHDRPPHFEEPLKFIPHGCIFRLQYMIIFQVVTDPLLSFFTHYYRLWTHVTNVHN